MKGFVGELEEVEVNLMLKLKEVEVEDERVPNERGRRVGQGLRFHVNDPTFPIKSNCSIHKHPSCLSPPSFPTLPPPPSLNINNHQHQQTQQHNVFLLLFLQPVIFLDIPFTCASSPQQQRWESVPSCEPGLSQRRATCLIVIPRHQQVPPRDALPQHGGTLHLAGGGRRGAGTRQGAVPG